jgi:hypothetical protein
MKTAIAAYKAAGKPIEWRGLDYRVVMKIREMRA